MNKPTITLGIPAYNEQNNIKKLILSLLDQDYSELSLEKIIISSDGSTDDTVLISNSIGDNRVVVISNKNRKGIARGLNQILSKSDSDVTVVLDADILITDKRFIKKLIYPILYNNIDLTASSIFDIYSDTVISKILSHSMKIKNIIFSKFYDGENIYNCHGLARAFSKNFAKNIKFPVSIGNDMYCYLECMQEDYKFKYVIDASVFYKLPKYLDDHKKQSHRFLVSALEMQKYFDRNMLTKELRIPIKTYYQSFVDVVTLILKNPILSIGYILMQTYLRLIKKEKSTFYQAWDMVESSK